MNQEVVRMAETSHRWRNPVWRHADLLGSAQIAGDRATIHSFS